MKKEVKIIAFYLPQFHRIPENDKWWGEGFTEWTNTQKAKPLFEGHYQPRIPYRHNYYDLLDAQTMEWQVGLAKKYGIYGFCYYHYWFAGKKLLEKPLEQMLVTQKTEFPFCLSWANESWTRGWDGRQNNILILQNYGDIKEWENHFNYLLQFFMDERYVKIDNKPLFIIYRTVQIKNIDAMMRVWDNLAKKNNFDGIFFIETLNAYQNKPLSKFSQGLIEFEPMYTLAHEVPIAKRIIRKIKIVIRETTNRYIFQDTIDYDYVWNKIIKRKSEIKNRRIFLGAFTDWDNTPRREGKARIFIGSNPKKFEFYLSRQIERAKQINSELIFINAWNEWAEGAYLEPDEKFGFQYLQALKNAIINNTAV